MSNFKRFEKPTGWKFDFFENADGKKVRYGHIKANSVSKGTVVITTGYADFIESYFETINDYLDRGFEVYAMDWAGQAGSERYDKAKPWLPNPNNFFSSIKDLHQFRDEIVKHDKEKPIFLSTHSMGGHIGLHCIQKFPDDFDFAIMAAPLADFTMSKFKSRLIEEFSRVATSLGFGNRKVNRGRQVIVKIKEDREEHKSIEPIRMNIHQIYSDKNPDLRIGDQTLATTYSTLKSIRLLNEPDNLKSIKIPVLIGVAEKDRLVDNSKILRAVKLIKHAKAVILKEANHAIWTEREVIRSEWFKHVDKFIADQIGLKQSLDTKPKPKFGM